MNGNSRRASESVQAVMEKYSAMVYRLAYARCGNKADAEDVYQDVFFKYFRTQPRMESEEHRKAWLIRTTIHTSINLFRRAWNRHIAAESFERPAAAPSEKYDALHAALGRLPEKYRVVIYLHYYEEIPTQEIAQMLNENPATIRSQLMRGRDRLKKLMAEVEKC